MIVQPGRTGKGFQEPVWFSNLPLSSQIWDAAEYRMRDPQRSAGPAGPNNRWWYDAGSAPGPVIAGPGVHLPAGDYKFAFQLEFTVPWFPEICEFGGPLCREQLFELEAINAGGQPISGSRRTMAVSFVCRHQDRGKLSGWIGGDFHLDQAADEVGAQIWCKHVLWFDTPLLVKRVALWRSAN